MHKKTTGAHEELHMKMKNKNQQRTYLILNQQQIEKPIHKNWLRSTNVLLSFMKKKRKNPNERKRRKRINFLQFFFFGFFSSFKCVAFTSIHNYTYILVIQSARICTHSFCNIFLLVIRCNYIKWLSITFRVSFVFIVFQFSLHAIFTYKLTYCLSPFFFKIT